MSGTRRTPIARSREPQVTETAVKIFTQMQRCSGERWWDLHDYLRRELHAKLWEWPCIEDPREGNPHAPGSYNHEHWEPDLKAQERWKALERGAREMRRQERAARRATKAVSESEREPVV